MKTYVLIKPAGLQLIPQLEKTLNNFTGSELEKTTVVKALKDAVQLIKGDQVEALSPHIEYVETGIMTNDSLSAAYPNLEPPKRAIAEQRLIDQPYGLIILEIPQTDGKILQELKGKLYTPESISGSGIRGKMKEHHQEIGIRGNIQPSAVGYLELGENFIHIPDSEDEVTKMTSFINGISRDRDGVIVLLEKPKQSSNPEHESSHPELE